LSKKYILLVEDNPDDIALTQIAFKKCRIAQNLIITRDGEEALDFIYCRGQYAGRDPKNDPQVIILDLKLPYISGLEVLRNIRENRRTSLIPVVILSSSISEKEMQDSYNLGASRYFRKPMDFDQFLELVQQVGSTWLSDD
jgi:CheY-like chemotaxis protein